ncbi:hypothetical protein CDAR_533351 [Caerostris darwini]|uniref:Uncharacterized protein n=1 Tax=Caerostris darwini TaxID=1538125 RepID=A0AAV4RRM1_9ARAC|nr:hypothetical protein CDAR_533351 [Caerostris darwini]
MTQYFFVGQTNIKFSIQHQFHSYHIIAAQLERKRSKKPATQPSYNTSALAIPRPNQEQKPLPGHYEHSFHMQDSSIPHLSQHINAFGKRRRSKKRDVGVGDKLGVSERKGRIEAIGRSSRRDWNKGFVVATDS